MARVTVEACLDKVGNRFDLVILAAKRARQLAEGFEPFVSGNDKSPVLALREIESGLVDRESIEKMEDLRLSSLEQQKDHSPVKEVGSEPIDLL